jgi:hypothetical protein
MDRGQEIIGLGGAAAVLDVPPETVRRYAQEGRLRFENVEEGGYLFHRKMSLGSRVSLAPNPRRRRSSRAR